MKLRIVVPKRYFKLVHEDEFSVCVELLANVQSEISFLDDAEQLDLPQGYIPFRSGQFAMSPADLKSAIEAYLNSVPSQEEIAAAMCEAKENGEVKCINPGKGMFTRIEQEEYSNGGSIMDAIKRMLMPFYKSPSDFLGIKNFKVLMSPKVFEKFDEELKELEKQNLIRVSRGKGFFCIAFTVHHEKTAYRDCSLLVLAEEKKANSITVEDVINE